MSPAVADDALIREYGSYLAGVRHGLSATGQRPGTCSTCATPVSGFVECFACHKSREQAIQVGIPFPIDEVAFLTYAVEGRNVIGAAHEREGRQAYSVLKGYKANPPLGGSRRSIAAWVLWVLHRWWPRGNGSSQWLWATVPSRKSVRVGEHPLHQIVRAVVPANTPEAVLESTGVATGRTLDPAAYSTPQLPGGRFRSC